MHTMSRAAVVGLGIAALAALSTGGPVVTSQPFSLPQSGSGQDVWNGPSAKRAGVRVSSTSGRVKVEASASGTTTALGQVDSNRSAVFEGSWDRVWLTAMASNSSGSFETRAPTEGYVGNDGIVGAGSLVLPSGGASFTVYGNYGTPTYRMITVKSAPGGGVTVHSSVGGPALLEVRDGDWSFCGVDSCPRFVVDGTGSVDYQVVDVRTGSGPCSGTASGAAGATDRAALDGSKPLVVTVENVGGSAVQVTSMIVGQGTANQSIPAGGPPVVLHGNLQVLQWTYVGAPGSVRLTVVGG